MRLRTPLSVAIGIALILFGVGGRAVINHWMSTRIVQPVDMRHHVMNVTCAQQIRLLDEIEYFVVFPGGILEPPVDLRIVRDLLKLDRGYYSTTDQGLLSETFNKLKIAGVQQELQIAGISRYVDSKK